MDETATTTTETTAAPVTAVAETPASTETTSAPSSFREAVDRMQAAEESASTEREPATTAQETPTAASGDLKPVSTKGPIPFDVHDTALKNARIKAVDEAKPQIEAEVRQRYESEFKQTYAGIERVARDDWGDLIGLHDALKADLIGTPAMLLRRALQHPEHAPRAKSELGRLFAELRGSGQSVETDGDEPQPDIPLEDGRAVYSADQQRKRDAWLIRSVTAQFDQKLQPFQQDRDRAVQQQREATAYQQATDVLKQWSEKPHFTEHKAEMLALMNSHPGMTLGEAYAEVLVTKVLPTASQKERAAVLADIHHKAGAGTLNPQSTTTAQPRAANGKFTPALVEAHFAASGA